MRFSSAGFTQQSPKGEKRCLNSELWHACAGPLVSLPAVGSRVVYFSQGHSEQVTTSTNKEVDAHIPNHPSLSPQLICQLHNVTMHDQSNGMSNLENVKCKLLHWEGTNLVVAEGQIASRDPKSKVHRVTLRPMCWKV